VRAPRVGGGRQAGSQEPIHGGDCWVCASNRTE
jgi:hypothetical protein